jgi:hypothetical protein
VVEAARHRPFAWGRHDCVTFAAACIEAVTGRNPIHALDPWHSQEEAGATIRSLAGRQRLQVAIDRIMAEHGWPAIDPRLLGRGDLCLVAGGKGRFAAICLGNTLAAPSEEGLSFFLRESAIAAWRIDGGSAGLRPAGGRDVRAPSGRAPLEAS